MVKQDKCEFAQPQLKALGHIIDRHGVSPDPEKVEAVKNFPRPARQESNAKKLKALRAFLGLLSYYRRFIERFAMMAKPLHDLVGEKGPFNWTLVVVWRSVGKGYQVSLPGREAALRDSPRCVRLRNWVSSGPEG